MLVSAVRGSKSVDSKQAASERERIDHFALGCLLLNVFMVTIADDALTEPQKALRKAIAWHDECLFELRIDLQNRLADRLELGLEALPPTEKLDLLTDHQESVMFIRYWLQKCEREASETTKPVFAVTRQLIDFNGFDYEELRALVN